VTKTISWLRSSVLFKLSLDLLADAGLLLLPVPALLPRRAEVEVRARRADRRRSREPYAETTYSVIER
jgi:hypothetical protein